MKITKKNQINSHLWNQDYQVLSGKINLEMFSEIYDLLVRYENTEYTTEGSSVLIFHMKYFVFENITSIELDDYENN